MREGGGYRGGKAHGRGCGVQFQGNVKWGSSIVSDGKYQSTIRLGVNPSARKE